MQYWHAVHPTFILVRYSVVTREIISRSIAVSEFGAPPSAAERLSSRSLSVVMPLSTTLTSG